MQRVCEFFNEPVEFDGLEVNSKLLMNIANSLQLEVSEKHVTSLSQLCDFINIGQSPDAIRKAIPQYLTTVCVLFLFCIVSFYYA